MYKDVEKDEKVVASIIKGQGTVNKRIDKKENDTFIQTTKNEKNIKKKIKGSTVGLTIQH